MKHASLFFLGLFFSSSLWAASILRSDSIDIKSTILRCDITDFVGKQIKCHANILIASKINGQTAVIFDLEGLAVDSVRWNGFSQPYSVTGTQLSITTPAVFNQGDTAMVDVFYHGQPVTDATWGGYYFVGNYSFQMGVGFNAQPHSFGRTWHPCFDNFVERSPYEFYITTTPDKMATTNGLFLDSTLLGNGNIEWHYKLDEEIPSYLAAVAVSDYVWVKKTLQGNVATTPAWIAARAADTNNVNGSFANLQSSFSMLEKNFGTHSFSKVGYTLVPFNAGAMEHATNIHIGIPYVNGTLTYETLIAHELAHHWWGDLVTCRTAGDMWLNEGWASYAESLHEEFTYGREAFKKSVRENHHDVLSRAHISDDGYRAISPMDSLHTYGTTVYSKGADFIHTLRGILGDSLFFNGTTAFLNANKFKDISSADLRDFLTTYSGINLNDFFNDFIFQAGFPHYSIDSTQVVQQNATYATSVFLRHRKHQAPNYYNNVPLEICFYDAQFKKHIYNINFTGRCMEFKVNLPFSPAMIVIDPDEKISDALTENEAIVNSIGTITMNEGMANVIVKAVTTTADSTLVRVEHHWVAPDRFSPNPLNGYVLNDVRYWRVAGINLGNIKGSIEFIYDKTGTGSFIDSSWLKNSRDSIRLFYRKDATQNWAFANDSLRLAGSTNNRGFLYAKEIVAGEYCFGIKRTGYTDPTMSDIPSGPCNVATSIIEKKILENIFEIYPNPVQSYVLISAAKNFAGDLNFYDVNGQKIFNKKIALTNQLQKIELPTLAAGIYFLELNDGHTAFTKKIIVQQ